MTNREKYGEEILDILERTGDARFVIDKSNNTICHCDDITCRNCLFSGKDCGCIVERIKWLNAEYKEPKKITIPEDTPIDAKILVSNDGENWYNRHMARFIDDCKIEAWEYGRTSWTTDTTSTWDYAKLPEEELNERPKVN